MARFASKLFCAAAFVVIAASSSAACLDPTQITLRVTTNVSCTQSRGTAITGGKPGQVEHATPSTVTSDCNAGGSIGSLVATPSDSKDVAAAFLVVQGVDRPAAECAASGFKGCIVARRIVRYLTHTPLVLPIAMHLVCKDVACDEFTTCSKTGSCVDARIADAESCADGDCFPPGDGPDDLGGDGGPFVDGPLADGRADGSSNDGSSGDGAGDGAGDGSNDGTLGDGSKDGAIGDSNVDAPPPGSLYCPPVVGGCATGNTCCWKQDGSKGFCQTPTTCGAGEISMHCNRRSDCGATEYCCATIIGRIPPPPPEQEITETHCTTLPGVSCSYICLSTADCPAGSVCDLGTARFLPSGIFGECKPAGFGE